MQSLIIRSLVATGFIALCALCAEAGKPIDSESRLPEPYKGFYADPLSTIPGRSSEMIPKEINETLLKMGFPYQWNSI